MAWKLAGLCLAFASVTVTWLRLNHAPPTWDEAWYLTNSLTMYEAWTEGGLLGFARHFLDALRFKPPLIAALPAPIYLVLGRNWHFGHLVNVLAMPVLFGSVWAIGKRLWNPRVGLLAVSIVGTMPLLYGLARWFLVEYMLAATVAAALWTLLVSEDFENSAATVGLGVLCGFGMLLKASFPVYVVVPVGFVLWRCRHRLRAVGLLAVPCLIVALPWYALHWRATFDHAMLGGYGDASIVQSMGAAAYLMVVIRDGISDYYVVMALIAALVLAFRRRLGALRSLAPLGLWAVAFFVFLSAANKDVRFIAPILPAFALGAACLLDAVAGRRAWIILAPAFVSMLMVSFGYAPSLLYARPYRTDNWRQEEILSALKPEGNVKRVVIGADRALFNVHNFELTAVQQRLPLRFETTAYQKEFPDLDSASVVVLKDGGEAESASINPHSTEVLQYVRSSLGFEELPFARPLPDGGVARIFRRVPSRAPVLPAFRADFGGMLELTGLAVTRTGSRVEVQRRWRALKAMDRDYWTFTHVIDPQDKIVAQLDHRMQNGDAPTTNWSPGDEAYENARVVLPALANLRVRFGVYYPATGERLSVSGTTALTSTLPSPP